MAIYNDGGIDLVLDNRGRYWVIDPATETRYEVGGPGSGSYKAAVTLYGQPRNVDTMLSGWNEHPGGAVDFFGGPNEMERVIAGLKPDPFTGYMVPNPQTITTGTGDVFTPAGQIPAGQQASYEQLMESLRYVPSAGDQERIIRQAGLWDYHITHGRGAGGAAGTGGGGGGGTSLTGPQRDAFTTTRRLLEEYGLRGLSDDVREWLVQGLSQQEVIQRIRDTDQYKRRFPGMEERRKRGLAPISEAQYIQLETTYRGIMRRAEMPRRFYNRSNDFTEFIANDISPAELEQRVADGIVAARSAPAEVRQALREFYGIGNTYSALAAYYLDPEKGLEAIQQEFRAAELSGVAQQTTFGRLRRREAERLEKLGVSDQQARQGFSDLASQEQLMDRLPGEVGSETVTRGEQMAAVFEGDADARDEIRRQRERRVSAFAGAAAGATSSREGLTGLSSG